MAVMAHKKLRGKRTSATRALADLNIAISATEEHRLVRSEVLRRFARIIDGKPALCEPPIEEQRMGHIPGAFKVIYDSWDNAWDAARELASLGSPPQKPYPCERGEHFHTRTLDQYQDEKKRA